jgi:hypothetical protein
MIGARFLREGAQLLDTLLTIPFASVVHAVLETLQRLVQCDPGHVVEWTGTARPVRPSGGGKVMHFKASRLRWGKPNVPVLGYKIPRLQATTCSTR